METSEAGNSSGCPRKDSSLSSQCPRANSGKKTQIQAVEGSHGEEVDPRNMMPLSSQEPHPEQPFSLSTDREKSKIPKDANQVWVYPSEQMFFNAMVKKGWNWKDWDMKREDMKHIIELHNRNNDAAWNEVLKWEVMHTKECSTPILVSFKGRSKDYSPRARLRSWMGYELPFDRHDWVVDRCGRKVRYVIDYYGCDPQPNNSTPIYLDVRPALDSFQACWDRMKAAWWRWTSSS